MMQNFLRDLSKPALVEAIEGNRLTYFADMGRSPLIDYRRDTRVIYLISEIPFPRFNHVVYADFQNIAAGPQIESIMGTFEENLVPFMWHITPSSKPAKLGQFLTARGFTDLGSEPGMAADLYHLNEKTSVPKGLTVELVQGLEMLETWCHIFAEASELPDWLGDAFYHVEVGRVQEGEPNRWLYLAFIDGKPVATSILYLSKGVAGIYSVATLPAYRRQGIGKFMTLQPLLEAREMGCRAGILASSKMGEGIYTEMGFETYCQLGRYIYPPPKAVV